MYERVELTIAEALLSERSEIRLAAVKKVEWYQNIRPSKQPENLFIRKWMFKIRPNSYEELLKDTYSVANLKCMTPGLHPFFK